MVSYELGLENKSYVQLGALKMSYWIYIDTEAASKAGFEEPKKVYEGRTKLETIAEGKVLVVRTNHVPLTELELDPDFVFTDGSRNDFEDELEGTWIKLRHCDKKVAEFKSDQSAVKKAKWSAHFRGSPFKLSF